MNDVYDLSAQPSDRRCGVIAIVGVPNAGKSTLLNRFVGCKLSIVTPKAQTTRRRILGITIIDTAQILFVDTPGIFVPRRRLDRAMVATAWHEARAADSILLMVDATKPTDTTQTHDILTRLKQEKSPTFLILNKIDRVRRDRLLTLAAWFNQRHCFVSTFMISALTGDGVTDIYHPLIERLPFGPWVYPPDQLTDLPMRLFAAEITRESVFFRLRSELPYTSTVESEKWEELEDGSVRLYQVIYVERPSQRAIVLGKNGHSIKTIGQAARQQLERCLNRRVHLKLFVKVRANWMNDRTHYHDMRLPFDA